MMPDLSLLVMIVQKRPNNVGNIAIGPTSKISAKKKVREMIFFFCSFLIIKHEYKDLHLDNFFILYSMQ